MLGYLIMHLLAKIILKSIQIGVGTSNGPWQSILYKTLWQPYDECLLSPLMNGGSESLSCSHHFS